MIVKVAMSTTIRLHWSKPAAIVPPSPSSSKALASAISSPSSSRWSRQDCGSLILRHRPRLDRSALLGSPSLLQRSRSYEHPKSGRPIRRICGASFGSNSDEEFSKKIQELVHKFQLEGDNISQKGSYEGEGKDGEAMDVGSENLVNGHHHNRLAQENVEPPWQEEAMASSIIERKANSVDLPLSLRIIQRKMQWQDGIREAGESAYCSVKKAFCSMVFIIRELQSFTLQMREILFYEDLQGILVRVQKEMHSSFVWLFQQIFSHTPMLMVYVMILLANFTVHSMSSNAAIVASGSFAAATTEETISVTDSYNSKGHKFDSSSVRASPTISSLSGRTTSIGGSNGGGNIRPTANGTEGDGQFSRSDFYQTIVPDGGGASHLSSFGGPAGEAESPSGPAASAAREEEVSLWNSVVDEAYNMQSETRDKALDHETMMRFVSPVTARIEADNDYAEYFRTELLYQTTLAQDPNNALLQCNYAQFLYLVAHDYDRAEEYFKKAVAVEPPDAEAHRKYASFLWKVRKDLWAAEETFLEAISADPDNSFYAADYAHFLWNTGGEDTCFPLNNDGAQEEAL
ncbi:hypothetical protein SAY86_008950 [Trapa natans]|uniref:Uncharacterized protein n=1 Tax=Trapa natans TaxID=22666 RepID=A0AAN7KBD4_TRANT|nr:hypothetical protein SAY86_008950 [Trapa natans]